MEFAVFNFNSDPVFAAFNFNSDPVLKYYYRILWGKEFMARS